MRIPERIPIAPIDCVQHIPGRALITGDSADLAVVPGIIVYAALCNSIWAPCSGGLTSAKAPA